MYLFKKKMGEVDRIIEALHRNGLAENGHLPDGTPVSDVVGEGGLNFWHLLRSCWRQQRAGQSEGPIGYEPWSRKTMKAMAKRVGKGCARRGPGRWSSRNR